MKKPISPHSLKRKNAFVSKTISATIAKLCKKHCPDVTWPLNEIEAYRQNLKLVIKEQICENGTRTTITKLTKKLEGVTLK